LIISLTYWKLISKRKLKEDSKDALGYSKTYVMMMISSLSPNKRQNMRDRTAFLKRAMATKPKSLQIGHQMNQEENHFVKDNLIIHH